MRPIQIRSAIPEDAGRVSEIYLASRHHFLPYAPLAHSDDEVRDWIANLVVPSGDAWVAMRGDEMVGMMALSDDGTFRWIEQLYITPQATGQGIGSMLLQAALQRLAPPVRLYTFQANEGARRFYERFGFEAIAFGDGSDNEEGCPDVLYEWRGNGAT